MLSRFGNRALLHSCRVASITPAAATTAGAAAARPALSTAASAVARSAAVAAASKAAAAAGAAAGAGTSTRARAATGKLPRGLVRAMHTGVPVGTATSPMSAAGLSPMSAASLSPMSPAAAAAGGSAEPGSAPRVTGENINPAVIAAEYAVRGELVIKADAYRKLLAATDKPHGLPFDEIISCNIGNPQELGQQPITFFRQVIALCHYPALMDNPQTAAAFPTDAIARARNYLASVKGGTGAYSASQGVSVVRDEVAAFITARDGGAHVASADEIFLTDGASSGVKMIINMLVRNEKDGIMIPIPQYPLYSATLTLNGGAQCGYYLDEGKGWALNRAELERSLADAKARGVTVRGLVVINPGNPTGQVLNAANMKEIVAFCDAHNIVLLADEVYQTNIYGSTPFTAFKKIVAEQKANTQLVSFHSVSKGFLGECGARGGYMELHNLDAAFKGAVLKLASISLCPNLTGQLVCGMMVSPPAPSAASYPLYAKERDAILQSLKRRAVSLAAALNAIEGISCQQVEGAMYAFPTISLPSKLAEAAAKAGKQPDVYYCLRLLDATGIVVVPGSGFRQQSNTWHFRTTILPPEAMMDKLLTRFRAFHENLMKEFK